VKPEGISPNLKRFFKFEKMWLKDSGCSATVTEAWGPPQMGASMSEVARKIQSSGERLTEWSKNCFGSIRNMLEEKRKLLDKAKLVAGKGGD